MMKHCICLAFLSLASCAYHFGPQHRQFPKGYEKVYVTMFENQSAQEVGIETDLTNAMINEISRSGLGKLTSKNQAELIITGTIHAFENRGQTPISTPGPASRSLFTEYQAYMTVMVIAIDNKTKEEVWQGQFVGEKFYKAPQITKQTLRTANPLYNQSARHHVIKAITKDIASEAVSRMSENF